MGGRDEWNDFGGFCIVAKVFRGKGIGMYIHLSWCPSDRTTLGLSHVEIGKKVMYTGFDPVVPLNRPLTHLILNHHPVLNGVT